MIQIRLLTDKLRDRLKTPLGTLLKGSFSQTLTDFEKLVNTKKPSMTISVGDALSKALIENDLLPKVIIIDHKTLRKPAEPFTTENYESIELKNSPGTISDEAWTAIATAIRRSGKVKVVVEGEEDLLTLVAILSAPEKALVVYGQPHEGMVVVEVTIQKKKEIQTIVDSMEQATSKS